MDENEVYTWLSTCVVTRKLFAGVIAQDELPQLNPKSPSFYVVNTDRAEGPGLHWTVVFITNNSCSEFFDSLARPPISYSPHFTNFLIANGPNYLMSKKRIQSSLSDACGQFCIYYAFHRCLAYTFEDILNMFSDTHLLVNDIKVQRFANKTNCAV